MENNQLNYAPFVLSSVLLSYPDESFHESVATLLEDNGLSINQNLRFQLENILCSESRLSDLRSEYISIFDHSKELNPLYETEYGRERAMYKANELSDIAAFYRAFGFEVGTDIAREMPDHIAVELEFYAILMMKYDHLRQLKDNEGVQIVDDAMKKFIADHLGRFPRAICDRPGVQSSEFYSAAMNWCSEVIESEAQRLNVTPEKASWYVSQKENETVSCGDTVVKN